ncbi:MAG: hypothetical protein WCS70_07825 [Verrucomicrobiota bacterium]
MAIFTSVFSLLAGLGSVVVILRLERSFAHLFSEMKSPPDLTGLFSPLQHPWLSLLLGIVIGFPSVQIAKRLFRPRTAFYAAFIYMSLRDRIRWKNYRESLIGGLPYIIGPWVAMGIAVLFGITPIPAFFGTGMWSFLTFPEAKTMYEAAQFGSPV